MLIVCGSILATDVHVLTIVFFDVPRDYYGQKAPLAGFSIPAAEHRYTILMNLMYVLYLTVYTIICSCSNLVLCNNIIVCNLLPRQITSHEKGGGVSG